MWYSTMMPHISFLPRPRRPAPFGARAARSRLGVLALVAMLQRRRKDKDKDSDRDGVPVEPNRPNTLSGGAEAPLEFDGD